MGKISKSFAFLLVVILAVSSLMMVKPAFAQTPTPSPYTLPTPSVPTFSLKFVESSYPKTIVDPYTGVESTQQVNNNSIEIIIKNQPFTPYQIPYTFNFTTSLTYNVQVKGHFEQGWTKIVSNYQQSSNSEYTLIAIGPDQILGYTNVTSPPYPKVDFQLEAIISGYFNALNENPADIHVVNPAVYRSQSSGWSGTQTITVPASSTATSTSPTPTFTSTAASSSSATSFWQITSTISLIVIAILLAVIIAMLFYFRKRKTPQSQANPS